MIQNLDKNSFHDLCDNALWIIMDPWSDQQKLWDLFGTPKECRTDIQINKWNKLYADRIYNFLPRVKNWLVIADLHVEHNGNFFPIEIDTRFKHLRIIEHAKLERNDIKKYIPKCNKIVYTGFHESYCIKHRPYVGLERINVENDNLNVETYIALELVCEVPFWETDKRLQKQQARRDSKNNKYIKVLDSYK